MAQTWEVDLHPANDCDGGMSRVGDRPRIQRPESESVHGELDGMYAYGSCFGLAEELFSAT